MKQFRIPLLLCLSAAIALSCASVGSLMKEGKYAAAYEGAATKKLSGEPKDLESLGSYYFDKKDNEKALVCFELALGSKKAALARLGDEYSRVAVVSERGDANRLKAVEYYRLGGENGKADKICEKVLGGIRWKGNDPKAFAVGWLFFKTMHPSEKDANLAWGRYVLGKLENSYSVGSSDINGILKMVVSSLEKGGADRNERISAALKVLNTLGRSTIYYSDKPSSVEVFWKRCIAEAENDLKEVLPAPEDHKKAVTEYARTQIGNAPAGAIRIAAAKRIGDQDLVLKAMTEGARDKLLSKKYQLRWDHYSSIETPDIKEIRESMIADLGGAAVADKLLGEWLFGMEIYSLSALAYESAGEKEKAAASWRAKAKQYFDKAGLDLKEAPLYEIVTKANPDPKDAWRETGDMMLKRDSEAAARCYLNAGLKEKGQTMLADLAKRWAASTSKDDFWIRKAAYAYYQAEMPDEARAVADAHFRKVASAQQKAEGPDSYYYESVYAAAYGDDKKAMTLALAKLCAELGYNEKAIGYYGEEYEAERRALILKEVEKRVRAGDLEKARNYAWDKFHYDRKISDGFLADNLASMQLYNEAYQVNLLLGRQAKADELLEKAVAEEKEPARRLAALGLVSRAGAKAAKKLLPVFAADSDPALSKPASFILGAKSGAKPRVALVNMGLPGRESLYGFLGYSGILAAKIKAFSSEIKKNEPVGFDTQLAISLGTKFETASEEPMKPVRLNSYWTKADQAKLDELAASGKYDVVVAYWTIPDERSNSNSSQVSVDYRFCAAAYAVGVGIWESFKTPEFHLGYRPSGAAAERDKIHAEAAKTMVKNEMDAAKEAAAYLKTVYGN